MATPTPQSRMHLEDYDYHCEAIKPDELPESYRNLATHKKYEFYNVIAWFRFANAPTNLPIEHPLAAFLNPEHHRQGHPQLTQTEPGIYEINLPAVTTNNRYHSYLLSMLHDPDEEWSLFLEDPPRVKHGAPAGVLTHTRYLKEFLRTLQGFYQHGNSQLPTSGECSQCGTTRNDLHRHTDGPLCTTCMNANEAEAARPILGELDLDVTLRTATLEKPSHQELQLTLTFTDEDNTARALKHQELNPLLPAGPVKQPAFQKDDLDCNQYNLRAELPDDPEARYLLEELQAHAQAPGQDLKVIAFELRMLTSLLQRHHMLTAPNPTLDTLTPLPF